MKQRNRAQEKHNHKASKRLRFKIEKLEERIAPKKGGVPGTPDGKGGWHCNPNKERCL